MSEQIVLSGTIAVSTGETWEEKCPYNGEVTELVIHFPGGCNALVDVAFGIGTKQITPRVGFIALDGATPHWRYEPTNPVKMNDVIWVKVENTDTVSTYTITAVVTIKITEESVIKDKSMPKLAVLAKA